MLLTYPRRQSGVFRVLGDRSGLALTEFALALPLLVGLTLTGIESANLVIATLRVNQLAMLAADNAGRVRDSIDEMDVNEIMAGIRFAGDGIKFGQNGRIIISSVESNGRTDATKGYTIKWQRCFGAKNVTSSYGFADAGASDATMAAGIGPADRRIKPVDGSALIFAEVSYTYKPLITAAFMPEQVLTATQAFTVRDRSANMLTNSSNMTDASKRLCDSAHLSAT